MPATILDGKAMAADLRAEIKSQVDDLRAKGITPGLAVALVGDDPASAVYVRGKIKACAEVGIRSIEQRLPAHTTTEALLALVDAWNARDDIDGILVQLPLPKHCRTEAVLERIRADKDVDGFGAENLGRLAAGRPGLVACTPAGVMDMLARYGRTTGWTLRGKHAVVVGRSVIVGRPMALLLLNHDATVTMCHSRTHDLKAVVLQADLVVAAVGQRHLVRGDWIKPGAVVIDVGMNQTEEGKLTGDVDFEGAVGHAAAISPVPRGVGPMTIAMLMANTVQACRARREPA
jgi:methylenetetrahydrofolate dehydrogenase (NADP+)/methenyltetrahydrofolate cyclohydrolase